MLLWMVMLNRSCAERVMLPSLLPSVWRQDKWRHSIPGYTYLFFPIKRNVCSTLQVLHRIWIDSGNIYGTEKYVCSISKIFLKVNRWKLWKGTQYTKIRSQFSININCTLDGVEVTVTSSSVGPRAVQDTLLTHFVASTIQNSVKCVLSHHGIERSQVARFGVLRYGGLLRM
jgi:hypothetical protein